jgi:hypothetical protein
MKRSTVVAVLLTAVVLIAAGNLPRVRFPAAPDGAAAAQAEQSVNDVLF